MINKTRTCRKCNKEFETDGYHKKVCQKCNPRGLWVARLDNIGSKKRRKDDGISN